MPAEDEYLDLVDENDVVIGKKLRSEVYAEDLNNFRVVNAFLMNSKGEIWIPRRAATKRIFPDCLDMSMGGHVESGETYDLAFKRETSEELNIDTDIANVEEIGTLTPAKNSVSAFMKLYIIHTDTAPNYNPDDFTEASWIRPEALLSNISKGEKTKGDLPTLVNFLLNYIG